MMTLDNLKWIQGNGSICQEGETENGEENLDVGVGVEVRRETYSKIRMVMLKSSVQVN